MKKFLLSLAAMAAIAPAYAGTGTAEDPYTCAEVIAMGVDLNVASAYVKGYIVGNASGAKLEEAKFGTADGASASNILIADEASCDDYKLCIPVQLVSKSEIRVKMNLMDNPGNLGKQILIAGQLVKYFNVPGLKAPTSAEFTGETGTPTEPTEPTEPTDIEVANIAAFLTDAGASDSYTFTNSVNVAYQNGNRLYVQDATGSMLIYGNVGQTYENGDVIPAGFGGNYGLFGQAPQLTTPVDFKASTEKTTVAPEELPIEEIGSDMVNKYIKIVGVTITEGSKAKYYVGTDETGEITIYDQFGITPVLGENLTVVGIYTTYNGAGQVMPIEVTDESGVVVERCAAPVFTPGAGAVMEGTMVTITCATEGAAIHYTLDGTEPTAASALYAEPIEIAEEMTIKAIAVKDGCEDSDIAVAEYTLRAASAFRGEFNSFNDGKTATNYLASVANATGWVAENCAVLSGNDADANSNPKFVFIDNSTETIAVCLNGKTTAVGKVTSPVLAGGIGTLTFKYGLPFGDKKIGLKVTIYDAEGNVLATDEIANDSATKFEAYEYSLPVNKEGDFKIEIVNTCPSSATKNADRVAIWNLTWSDPTGSAINAAVANDADAPVEYFNLQGVRVANPEGGLFIRRQGSKVEKVVIR